MVHLKLTKTHLKGLLDGKIVNVGDHKISLRSKLTGKGTRMHNEFGVGPSTL